MLHGPVPGAEPDQPGQGTDFPYRPFLPDRVPVVQVDVRGEQIGKRVQVRVPLVGTVKDTVDALLPLLEPEADSAHLDRMTAHYRRARSRLDKLARDRASDSRCTGSTSLPPPTG